MSTEQPLICEELQPWLTAYALGEREGEPAWRAHLAVCPSCQQSLHEYRQVSGLLPYDAAEVAPPAHLRAQLIAAVGAAASEPAAAAAAPRAQPALAHSPRRHLLGRVPAWAAYAFAALALALLLWNVNLRGQLNTQSVQIAANRQSWQAVIALLNDSSLRWYAVAGEQARGHFWATPQGEHACMVAQQLPALAEGQVYQVWLAAGAEQTSGGTFEAREGNGWVLLQADEPLSTYTSVFVTVEPAGGSAAPSGQRVLAGSLAGDGSAGAAERWELARLLETDL